MRRLIISALCIFISATLRAESKSDVLIGKIISQLKIAEQFDADLKNLPASVTADTREGREQIWLAGVRVREMGWLKVRDAYVREMKVRFSESELEILVGRLDDPLIAKLMDAHLKSLKELSELRAQLFQSYWSRYNDMEFVPPDDVINGKQQEQPTKLEGPAPANR